MAGGGYNIGSISVPAKFQGEEDNVEGSYVVVMYEDKTYPIILRARASNYTGKRIPRRT